MSTVPAGQLESELDSVSPKSQEGGAAYVTDISHPELEAHMAKYDVNGDGVFSADEVSAWTDGSTFDLGTGGTGALPWAKSSSSNAP